MPSEYITIDQSWYERPDGVPLAISGGGAVCRVADDRVLVALTREPHATQFVLPKGRIEAGEGPEQAARREIGEETGVTDLHLLDDLGVLERLSFDKRYWKRTHYLLFATRQVDLAPLDRKHGGLAGWFPLNDPPPLLWPEQANLLRSKADRIAAEVRRWVSTGAAQRR